MRDRETSGWEQWIGRIDRRVMYLGLFLVTLIPMVFKWSLALYETRPSRMLKETIEALPPGKLVFISSNWEAGSQAETRPQTVAIVRHLIRRGQRFAVLSIGNAVAPQFAQAAIEEAIRLENAGERWQYGRDWVNLGFKIASRPWLRSFTLDIPGAILQDWRGTPVAQIPVMQGVRRFGPEGQVSMLIDITGVTSIESWYEFISPTKTKIGLGCTAVMAPEQYPFLDSGQLSGMLTGMKGAAEYEQLVNAPGAGLPAMTGQSFAHLYIFVLILLGNLSLLAGRRRRDA